MNRTRTEDMIVKILTPTRIKTLYRFYGARHSIINIGRKIDFEEEPTLGFMPKLKNILHLAYKWELQTQRLYVWQYFIKLLGKHLVEIEEIESFYFELLEWGAERLLAQNPKRVGLEMYAKLLQYEGRSMIFKHSNYIHTSPTQIQGAKDTLECFICQKPLNSSITLGRAFLFAHKQCIGGKTYEQSHILYFLQTQSTIWLSDSDIEELWEVLGLGF